MRLTNVLFRQNYYRTIKRVWKSQGKMQIAPAEIPPELKAMGVKIYDALDVARGKVSDGEDTDLALTVDTSDMEKYYLFDNKVKISDNENPVLALTKTISYDGLPPILKSLIGKEFLPDQDKLVQNCILQALVRDAHLYRLPKIINLKDLGRTPLREYGIRNKRKVCNLVQKLAFLSEMASGKFSESRLRARNIDAFTELVIDRGDDTIVFQMSSDILLSSQKPLRPFASPEEVELTKDKPLPSIYPVKPTIDLWKCETNPCKFTGIDILDADVTRNLHVHTLHVLQKSFGYWSPVQKLARSIATCFTFAAEEAKRLYGADVKLLPKPINLQCICTDLKSTGFLAYQLNTLDISEDDGIKNQVWIEAEKDLYGEVSELNGITDYNSDIFPIMLAFYLNGLHPSSL